MPRRGPDRDRKPAPPKCSARKADGRPCGNVALRGTTRCWHHSFKVPGRPTKLTAELRDRILDAVLEGNYLETAAQVAGVGKTTLYRWLRRAEELEATAMEHVDDEDLALDGLDLWQHVDPALWVYLDFRHALKSAEAYAETELVRQTLNRGRNWQAAMTVLERRHPSRWGRRLDAHVTSDSEVRGKVEVVAPTDDARAAAVASILSGAGALDGAGEDPDPED